MEIINKSKVVSKVYLKNVILKNFTQCNGKFFYSIEVTPKEGLKIDFNEFKVLPLFIDITWIDNQNLNFTPIKSSPSFELASKIDSSHVVNSITCNSLTDENLDEILSDSEMIRNFTILRGGKRRESMKVKMIKNFRRIADEVKASQKFKFANELIAEVRKKTDNAGKSVTIFAGGYPEGHLESKSLDEDVQNLKRKVESGVDIILTQVFFSADTFIEFVKRCRESGINVPIIPGLYIPYNFRELKMIFRITEVSMEPQIYEHFEKLKDNHEEFQKFSLTFVTKMVKDIQERSSEFILGFHFYSMNNFAMIQKLIETVDVSEA